MGVDYGLRPHSTRPGRKATENRRKKTAGGILRIDCADWDCFFDYGIRYDLDADGFR